MRTQPKRRAAHSHAIGKGYVKTKLLAAGWFSTVMGIVKPDGRSCKRQSTPHAWHP